MKRASLPEMRSCTRGSFRYASTTRLSCERCFASSPLPTVKFGAMRGTTAIISRWAGLRRVASTGEDSTRPSTAIKVRATKLAATSPPRL
jgi:hypothetical protein